MLVSMKTSFFMRGNSGRGGQYIHHKPYTCRISTPGFMMPRQMYASVGSDPSLAVIPRIHCISRQVHVYMERGAIDPVGNQILQWCYSFTHLSIPGLHAT